MKHQPDLLLAKTHLRLVEQDLPDAQRDATIDVLACVVTLAIVGAVLWLVLGRG